MDSSIETTPPSRTEMRSEWYECETECAGIYQVKRIKDKIKELLDRGIIVEAERCEWQIPARLVVKTDGEMKLCMDFKELNAVTEKDNYPLPNITEITDGLRDQHYFSKISIKDAFYAIPLEKDLQHKTTFKIGKKFYKFAVLPWGFRNTKRILQRAMENILHEYLGKFCRVYIDSVIIFSKDLASHEAHLKAVVEKLEQNRMEVDWDGKLAPEKEIEFMGYTIGHNTIRPLQSRVERIKEYPVPDTKKQLRKFIGLLGCDRKFLHRISETLKPLHKLGKKDTQWKWKKIHQKAFDSAKSKLARSVGLAIPDYNKRFTLETSISKRSMHGVLKQGKDVVKYLSGSFAPRTRKYTTGEKELYAVCWAIQKFRYYLEGAEFDLITDHLPIIHYHNTIDSERMRIKRLHYQLTDYTFAPYYKGKDSVIQSGPVHKATYE